MPAAFVMSDVETGIQFTIFRGHFPHQMPILGSRAETGGIFHIDNIVQFRLPSSDLPPPNDMSGGFMALD
jgi:hypothetical protein